MSELRRGLNGYDTDVFIQGKEIYFSHLNLDKDGEVINIPLSYVDVINKFATNVRYVLTVEKYCGIQNVFIRGPITFTALQLRP